MSDKTANIQVVKRVRVGEKGKPLGERVIAHEGSRIILETDIGEFSFSMSSNGELEVLCMSSPNKRTVDQISIRPLGGNKISISFLPWE